MPPTSYTGLRPTSPILTDLAVGSASNLAGRYKALELGPLHTVPEIKGKIKKRPINDSFRRSTTEFPINGPMKGSSVNYTELDFYLFLAGWAMRHDVRLPQNDLPGALPVHEMDMCNEKIYMDMEFGHQTILTTLGNYLTTHRVTLTSGSGTQFNQVTSNPTKVFNDALEAITLTTSGPIRQVAARQRVWDYLAAHSQVIDRARGYTGSTASSFMAQTIAEAYGFTKAVVLDAAYDSSIPGATASLARIWGNDMIFQVLDDAPSDMSLSHTKTLSLYGGVVESGQWQPTPYLNETYVQAAYKLTILNQYAGYLVKDAITSGL
jgi:hypothetical protein